MSQYDTIGYIAEVVKCEGDPFDLGCEATLHINLSVEVFPPLNNRWVGSKNGENFVYSYASDWSIIKVKI